MITVENLKKAYFDHLALDDVSFHIKEGQIVGLLGLNGAGKSTILKILGTFLLPSAGRALLNGYSVEDNPQEVRRIIGFLPDMPPLYNEMTVESYLKFAARLKEVPSNKIMQRLDYVSEKVALKDVFKVPIGELSHGFRQRVGIAQALINDPKVVILDEPISGLDPIQIVEVRDLINSLRGSHTVLLSSHILSEITKTCDHILMIDRGRLVIQGRQDEIEDQLMRGGNIRVVVASFSAGIKESLTKIPSVTSVEHKKMHEGTEELIISCDSDVRSEIARAIVQANGALLALEKAEAGLEKLFVKLVNSSK